MGKFVVKETATGVKFDLKASNGEVIATSEVYASETACMNGVESVRTNCAAAVEDQTVENFEAVKHPKYEVYTDKSGEFRFRLKARNGEIIDKWHECCRTIAHIEYCHLSFAGVYRQ